MTRRLIAAGTLTFLFGATTHPATSPIAPDSPLELAHLAWDRGDYVAALNGYLAVLDSADGDAALESIALQTGELYRSIEVTRDGLLPQFSPDDQHFLYERGTGARRIIRIVATAAPTRPIAEMKGWGAAFSIDGTKVAYVQAPAETPEIAAAQTALEAAASAPAAERNQKLAALNDLVGPAARVVVREIASGRETVLDTGSLSKAAVFMAAGDTVLFSGNAERTAPQQIHIVSATQPLKALTTDAMDKVISSVNASGTALLFTTRAPGTGRGSRGGAATPAAATPGAAVPPTPAPATPPAGPGRGGRGGGAAAPPARFTVMAIPDGTTVTVSGSAPAFSADGNTLVYVNRTGEEMAVMAAATREPAIAAIVRKGPERMDAPAASTDGNRIAFQMMTREDWEIVTIGRDGTGESRLTRDAQHDLLPQFLTADRVLAVIGEARHRRAFVYDLAAGTHARLHHNNTVRTIAPEYLWEPTRDGSKILVVAERDGDTVSTERGIYLIDLTAKVTKAEVRARVTASLAAEQALRAKGQRLFAPFAAAIRPMVEEASVSRIYAYQKALFDFDSKHISRPGNKLASAYLLEKYRSFGYDAELQWFDRENALGGKTANVLATLTGTVTPELIYVVSSHYDSVAVGPGADDDSSGTAALLETARIMAQRPQPATIVFASFTGEEAGLLGSREFVRRAVADKRRIVGALNNDMVGWANDHRLDSTIRYSNAGIRDIQHAAAMQFSNLLTYDALYYKSTDAAAYFEAFGDIVGGIGSYPVLSSPHYHQSHDVLENMNHQLITEVARTTAATLVLMASSPSRLTGLKIDRLPDGSASLSWTPSPETGVTGYVIAYGPPEKPEAQTLRVSKPTATLKNAGAGTRVAVKAVTAKGIESWDAVRAIIP